LQTSQTIASCELRMAPWWGKWPRAEQAMVRV
jgi:hypothetical protein